MMESSRFDVNRWSGGISISGGIAVDTTIYTVQMTLNKPADYIQIRGFDLYLANPAGSSKHLIDVYLATGDVGGSTNLIYQPNLSAGNTTQSAAPKYNIAAPTVAKRLAYFYLDHNEPIIWRPVSRGGYFCFKDNTTFCIVNRSSALGSSILKGHVEFMLHKS